MKYFILDQKIKLLNIHQYISLGKELLMFAFGENYIPSMVQFVGEEPNLIEVIDEEGECAFAALYTSDSPAKNKLSYKISPFAPQEAKTLVEPETVILDYAVISLKYRNQWGRFFQECCRYLAQANYQRLYSECQLLRQVDFYMIQGYQILNPPPFSVRARIRQISRFLTGKKPPVSENEIRHLLFPGESFFYYRDRYFKPTKWNIFLSDCIYIKIPLQF